MSQPALIPPLRNLSSQLCLFLSWTAFALLFAVRYLEPSPNSNELVRFVAGLRLSNPTLWPNDWGYSFQELSSVIYDYLLSLLFIVFSPTTLALVGRIVLSIWFLYTLTLVCHVLKLSGLAVPLASVLWLYSDQSILGGEFILGSCEPKSISYPFVNLAICAALKGSPKRTGIYLALAMLLHPFVGLWSCAALGLTLSIGSPQHRLANTFHAVFPCCAVTALLAVALFLQSDGASLGAEDIRLYVYFRNAHHLNPFAFGSPSGFLLFALSAISPALLLRVQSDPQTRLLVIFLLCLGFCFLIGVFAAVVDFRALLMSYPFRVPPTYCLLFSYLLFVDLVLRRIETFPAWPELLCGILLVVNVSIAIRKLHNSALPKLWNQWSVFAKNGFREEVPAVSNWIRAHSQPDAQILFPPLESRLWFFAERSTVASFKYHPPKKMREWMERITLMNDGKEFQQQGTRARPELDLHYSQLRVEILKIFRDRYAARYYVVATERKDLEAALKFHDDQYFVYDLSLLPIQ